VSCGDFDQPHIQQRSGGISNGERILIRNVAAPRLVSHTQDAGLVSRPQIRGLILEITRFLK
jgi:hypothetical protein